MTNNQLQIQSFVFGPFETNTYVVSDDQHILLVDPACYTQVEQQELEKYIETITHQQSPITIIATHGHLDHLWGAKWATEKWNTPVLMHEADIPMALAMQAQYNLFGIRRQAESFPIEALTAEGGLTAERSNSATVLQQSGLSILSTPGHTPGSICLYWPQSLNLHSFTPSFLISGDTLFYMGYGRTDLPGGNMSQLIASLEHLFTLPSDTRVFPGHGASTTIGAEKR